MRHTFSTQMKSAFVSIIVTIRLMTLSGKCFGLLVALVCGLIVCSSQAQAQQTAVIRPRDKGVKTQGQPPLARAQAPVSSAPSEESTSQNEFGDDDISIIVNLRADSLKFEVVPNPTVEFFGKPDRNTVWEVERDNLPRPVQPGVTYRDIGIRLRITSRFRDIERIVAEALGEIPISDDATTEVPAVPPKAPETVSVRPPQKGRHR